MNSRQRVVIAVSRRRAVPSRRCASALFGASSTRLAKARAARSKSASVTYTLAQHFVERILADERVRSCGLLDLTRGFDAPAKGLGSMRPRLHAPVPSGEFAEWPA